MPLNKKGKKILKSMKEQYGPKAKQVFYASLNKGVIKNVEKKEGGGLSGGKRFGPPPEKGPNPQGLKIKKASMGLAIGILPDRALSNSQTARDFTGNLGLGGKMLSNYYNKKNEEEKEEQKPIKAYLGVEVRQPTETKKEFGTRHEIHTKLKESDIFRKGSKVSDASPKLKQGGQLKTKKAMGGVFAVKDLFERSQTARDIGSQLGLAPRFLADKYNEEAREKKEQFEAAEQKKSMGLKQGGMSCPYRRGGKTSIQGVSKIQVKGQKFIGVR